MKIIRYVNGEQIQGGLSGYAIANDGVLRLLALSLGAWEGGANGANGINGANGTNGTNGTNVGGWASMANGSKGEDWKGVAE